MVIVNPTPRKTRRYKSTLTAVIVVSAVICIAWLIALSLIRKSIDKDGSKTTTLRGQIQSVLVEQPKGTMNKQSAKYMLQSKLPYIVYGTAWKKDATASLVSKAVESGFRFIDTACQPKHYNEAGVGEGWKDAAAKLGLTRSDFFLQTKFTSLDGQDPNKIPYDELEMLEEQVEQSLAKSLENLQSDYIDSLVMHSPMRSYEETLRVWRVFESFVEENKVRQLGLANCYDQKTFLRLYEDSHIKPKVLQNRFYSQSGFDSELRDLCDAYGVTYQSFWTLSANREAIKSHEWKAMALNKNLTPQTLMYAYMMSLGHTPLSGTTDVTHMKEDVDIMMRFQNGEEVLSKDDVETLSSLLGVQE
mmetsp:Transcript_34858/g.71136  ORF Transcript_34858/g.71136 Transcript_34858/m.71136 type:complete len:360 (-) Transcript_34858:41-1120(-)